MLRWLVLLGACSLLALARPSSEEKTEAPIAEDAICPESRIAYFTTIRAEPMASAAFKQDDVDEEKCNKWCTTNLSPTNKPFNCSSYSYNDDSRRCKLYAERTYPDGPLERRTTSKPKRFFEKYCLPERIAKKCSRTSFMRVDEMLLSGFAQATANFQTLAECMTHCIEETEFACKSAMYFYEEGECITNLETIHENATLVHVEDDDRVVFLQNDCYLKKEAEKHKKEEKKTTKTAIPTTQPPTTPTTTTTTAPEETTIAAISETTTAETKSVEITTAARIEEETTQAEIEKTDAPKHKILGDSKQRKEYKPLPPRKEVVKTQHIDLDVVDSAQDTSSSAPETQAPEENFKLDGETEKAEETTPQQPQLYGAETLKADANLGPEHVVDTLDLLTTTEFSLLKAAKTDKLLKDKSALKEFQILTPPGDLHPVSEENRFFSAWGSWTPCSNVGERRVRRRKCLDLKKCRGSLMQLDYCPAELVLLNTNDEQAEEDAFSRGPVGPIRQPLPIAEDGGNPASGSPPAILPPQLPQKPRETLPEGAPGRAEDVWSPWLGVCQHFVSTQPCKNNQVIGFESRECIAKDAQACKGPFFRYCTLPC
ncbi:hypothetical protein M3Y99_01354400 [Aphelenchoides fujianensis]|nr:hypothetical protein M3Y99_01354400 [Aphelenchoides fujianensis]